MAKNSHAMRQLDGTDWSDEKSGQRQSSCGPSDGTLAVQKLTRLLVTAMPVVL